MIEIHLINGIIFSSTVSLDEFAKTIDDLSKQKRGWIYGEDYLVKISKIAYVKEINQ